MLSRKGDLALEVYLNAHKFRTYLQIKDAI